MEPCGDLFSTLCTDLLLIRFWLQGRRLHGASPGGTEKGQHQARRKERRLKYTSSITPLRLDRKRGKGHLSPPPRTSGSRPPWTCPRRVAQWQGPILGRPPLAWLSAPGLERCVPNSRGPRPGAGTADTQTRPGSGTRPLREGHQSEGAAG